MGRHITGVVVFAALVVGSLAVTEPAGAIDGLSLVEIARLDQPLAMAVRAGDGALYIAEKGGRVRAIRNGAVDPLPVLDLTAEVSTGSEQGLLGLVFAPDGRHLYVNYTDRVGDTRIHQFDFVNGRASLTGRREVLFIDQPFSNHNGGALAFGPDGNLYIPTGDGGSGNDPGDRAQNIDSLLGKVLRIRPTPDVPTPYAIPAGNPFVGRAGADEVWALGLRNPWRFSFDRSTDDIWIGDVGQGAREEVDFLAAGTGAGANFGWSALEGTRVTGNRPVPAAAIAPVHEYATSGGNCAVTGGYVHRGTVDPLRGAYVFGDFCGGRIMRLRGGEVTDLGLPRVPSLASFGEDAAGDLYALSLQGAVYRIDGPRVPSGSTTQGYCVATALGTNPCFGTAGSGGAVVSPLASTLVDVAMLASGRGYWLAAADGGVFTRGDARFFGSAGAIRLSQPIVAMAATPSGNGYWLAARDGGVFSFGDARFHGSTGGTRLNQPVVGMASAPDGRGYWLVASDGGIFSFGSARFHGSTGAVPLNQPVTGMSATPSGNGYWLVASDGGVFSFGDARFHGSTGGLRLVSPVTGMSRTASGDGYRFVAEDGGVFSFGDARYLGRAATSRAGDAVVAIASVG